jgi:mono/diheme cytochrome c family protein
MNRWRFHLLPLLTILTIAGCKRNDMRDQPRADTYQDSDFFPDGKSARPLVAGTVPRFTPVGVRASSVASARTTTAPSGFPMPVTRQILARGRERYSIYCSVCHGDLGDGNGMIVQRGFTRPPTFHQPRLRDVAPSHFYDVITNGYGAMYSYNDRVEPDDRWAITAYIRALQLSQHAPTAALADADRARLQTPEVSPR